MSSDRAPGPSLLAHSLLNLRDVGGHPTRDGGRVRTGLLYRSTDLHRLEPDDAAALEHLGIRSVYDLRTEGERAGNPDLLPPGSRHVVVDVLRDSSGLTPAHMGDLLASPEKAEQAFGGGRSATFFVDAYREFVHLASARAGYGRLFAEIAVPEHRPALVHCTTGKDRTGWAATALLMLLGVPDDVVMAEYLLSGPNLVPLFQPALDAFEARGGDPELLRPLVDVRPAYLESALGEMRRTFGTVERYFAEGLGIDTGTQRALRAAFVEAG
jgi:protein-tyrosine phosphatase